MHQILQSLQTGQTMIENVPCPKNLSTTMLVETTKTLVSAGTERMLLEFGKANWLKKIKQQPDKVAMVLEKIKTDGFFSTINAVKSKLDQPIPLGYCNVGKIIEVGDKITGFSVGDRVVSNGYHAEIIRVAQNGCARIPDNVSDETAAFTVVSAIALQGIRLSQPTLGECYVVIGLGLIGLLAVQLLKANGCRVLGVDFDEQKCALAEQFGAEVAHPDSLITTAALFSRARGVDAVIITAATQSNELLHQAAVISRKRGRIILIGVIGKELSRADFYEKELSFQVSCSYGPGRYDENYEKNGQDYPVGFVRWTQQRNFEAVLDMMSQGILSIKPLISAEFDISESEKAYIELEKNKSVLGILINYSNYLLTEKIQNKITLNHQASQSTIQMGLLGAGNYGAAILAPAFKKTGIYFHTVVSNQGISAKRLAKKLGFQHAATDEQLIFNDKNINCAVIATQHHLHAEQIIQALENNKHVFVEKPLAIYLNQLEKIKYAYEKNKNNLLMIGFNRRFSPHAQTIKKLLTKEKAPKSFIMTVNAGFIPSTHWTQDINIGGGRIIGEACHFIDLLRYLAGNSITSWHAESILSDSAIITLKFLDGSSGAIHYLSNGHKSFPKETLEVFCNNKILHLNNFRKLTGFGFKNFKKQNFYKQNKGQTECVAAFINAIKNAKTSPILFDEIIEVSRISIEIGEFLRR